MPMCVGTGGFGRQLIPVEGFMCEECLVYNILWHIILVVRVDRPTDCQCYYCCLSAVVMNCMFQMSHTNVLSSKRWRLNENTTDEVNTPTSSPWTSVRKLMSFPSQLISRSQGASRWLVIFVSSPAYLVELYSFEKWGRTDQLDRHQLQLQTTKAKWYEMLRILRGEIIVSYLVVAFQNPSRKACF